MDLKWKLGFTVMGSDLLVGVMLIHNINLTDQQQQQQQQQQFWFID